MLRGSLDICVRDADGSLLVADLKTTALAGASPRRWSRASTRLQRSIYALAALRSGAPAARDRVLLPRAARGAGHAAATPPTDAEGLAAEVRRGDRPAARVRASPRAPATHCATCPGARPPLPGAGLARTGGRMSRLNASSPPESRVRAILRRLRVAYPERAARSTSRRRGSCSSATILSAQCTDERVNMVTPGLFRALSRTRRRSPTPTRARSPRRSSRRASTTRRRARCAELRWPCSSATAARCRAAPSSSCGCRASGRKTAAVVSGNAFGRREGIAVDTHVGRLTRRLGLTAETDPEKVERDLMAIVPRLGLGRVVAPADLARPRRLHLARAALPASACCSICAPRARPRAAAHAARRTA